MSPQMPGFPDHATPTVTTEGVSPKAIAPTVLMTLVGVLIATLNMIQDGPGVLGALPTWAQTVALALIPPALTFLAAYRASPGTVTLSNRS